MGTMYRLLLCTAVLLVLAACGSAPGSGTLEEVVDLDMYVGDGGTATATGPVLASGRTYRLHVQGTYSIWGESMWNNGTCLGTAEDAPMFPSSGGSNSTVGIDAEYYFAVPNGSALCSEEIPNQTGGLEVTVDGGADWFHPDVLGGVSVPTADHTYDYEVVGQGVAVQFRRVDSPSSDNYGVLRITITEE